MAEEPRRVRGQEDPRHRRHPVTPLSSERDPHHASHARLVADAYQKGHRVAPHPEPVVVLRGAAGEGPGEDGVHPIEAALRLPEVALDAVGDEPRSIVPAAATHGVADDAVQTGQVVRRAHVQRAGVEAGHDRCRRIQVDRLLVPVRGGDVAPVRGEGGRHQPARGIEALSAHVLEGGIQPRDERPAGHRPPQPGAVAGDGEHLRGGAHRAGLLVALGGIAIGGQHDAGGAEHLRRARSVGDEPRRLPGRDPVLQGPVRPLMGEVLFDPGGQVLPRVEEARGRNQGGAVAQPDLRVERARSEAADEAGAAAELLAVRLERRADQGQEARDRLVGGGVGRLRGRRGGRCGQRRGASGAQKDDPAHGDPQDAHAAHHSGRAPARRGGTLIEIATACAPCVQIVQSRSPPAGVITRTR